MLLQLLLACAPGLHGPVDDTSTSDGGFDAFDAGPGAEGWRWRADPELTVVLRYADDAEHTQGLYVAYEEAVLATFGPRSWMGREGFVPLLLVWRRADGTPALVDDAGPLVLALSGSTEHGCPADDLTLTLLPEATPLGIVVRADIEGVPYLALPEDGRITVTAGGAVVAPDLAAGSWSSGDAEAVYVRDSSLGDLSITAADPLPWLQLEPWDGFVELDFDHGCEDGATRPRLRVDAFLPD